MRFLALILPGSLESRADGKPVLSHSSFTDGSAARSRRVSRFCSWTTLTLLLAVPALRLVNEVNEHIANTPWSWAAVSPAAVRALSPRWNDDTLFTADEMEKKAVPLLSGLAAVPGEPRVIRGMAGHADGTTQHLWNVLYTPISPARTAADGTATAHYPAILAEATYNANTEELISVNTLCDLEGQPFAVGSERLRPPTETEAVQEARAWLSKMGLWAGQPHPSPVVFAPQQSSSGIWRVWLQGRETPGGPLLTVAIAVNSRTEAQMQARIVERSAFPSFYLPRPAKHR